MKAIWNGTIIAECDDTIEVEGNHYFPPTAIKKEFIEASDHHTFCPWKGTASYYHLKVDGKMNENAVWFYPEPKEMARELKDRVAFWKGVEVTK